MPVFLVSLAMTESDDSKTSKVDCHCEIVDNSFQTDSQERDYNFVLSECEGLPLEATVHDLQGNSVRLVRSGNVWSHDCPCVFMGIEGAYVHIVASESAPLSLEIALLVCGQNAGTVSPSLEPQRIDVMVGCFTGPAFISMR